MMLSSYEKIANRFAEEREKSGKTQADVAAFLGVTYQAVSNWERGRTKIDSVSLLRCLLWFGTDIYAFLGKCDFQVMQRIDEASAERERSLLRSFYMLDDIGQSKVEDYAADLVRSDAYSKKKKTSTG